MILAHTDALATVEAHTVEVEQAARANFTGGIWRFRAVVKEVLFLGDVSTRADAGYGPPPSIKPGETVEFMSLDLPDLEASDGSYVIALTFVDPAIARGEPTAWLLGAVFGGDGEPTQVVHPLAFDGQLAATLDAYQTSVRSGTSAQELLVTWVQEFAARRQAGELRYDPTKEKLPPGTVSFAFYAAHAKVPDDGLSLWESTPPSRRGLDPAIVPAPLRDELISRPVVVRIEDPHTLSVGQGVVVMAESGVAYAAEATVGSHSGELWTVEGETLRVGVTDDVDRMTGLVYVGEISSVELDGLNDALYIEFSAGDFRSALVEGPTPGNVIVGVVRSEFTSLAQEWATVDEWRLAKSGGQLDPDTSDALVRLEERLGVPAGFSTPPFVEQP